MSDAPDPIELIISCPHCGGRVTVEVASEPREYQCWNCGQDFEMPPMQLAIPAASSSEITDDTPDTHDPTDDELDGNRIRQLSLARRAAWRTRSYVLILAMAGFVVAVQLMFMAAATVRTGINLSTVLYALAALIALTVASRAWKRAQRMKREIEASSHHDDPDRPPDFRSLSDGSQRWNNLNDVK
jgi:DNA-directed RNA polymerase subunit RPC12/RpoP